MVKDKLLFHIKESDQFTDHIAANYHLDGDSSRKSYLGGICSISIGLTMLILWFIQGHAMVTNKDPYIQSIETPFDQDETGEVHINETLDMYIKLYDYYF